MRYSVALRKALDKAKPAEGLSRTELEEGIAKITEDLKSPMGDAERIMLCADRESLRKALMHTDHIKYHAPITK
jgi:hypothetical protein